MKFKFWQFVVALFFYYDRKKEVIIIVYQVMSIVSEGIVDIRKDQVKVTNQRIISWLYFFNIKISMENIMLLLPTNKAINRVELVKSNEWKILESPIQNTIISERKHG